MTPRKSLKQLDLPVGLFVQPKSQDTSEIENKMKEIMQLSGILCINGKVSNEIIFYSNSYVVCHILKYLVKLY